MRARGYRDEQITMAMKRQGYSEQQIQQLLKPVGPQYSQRTNGNGVNRNNSNNKKSPSFTGFLEPFIESPEARAIKCLAGSKLP